MALAMYEWLSSTVAGSSRFRGWELAGTLNPANPDPTKIPPPPKWRTPDVMMRSLCAWNAAAAQEFLLQSGFLPLVRVRVDSSGNPVSHAGVRVLVQTWRAEIGTGSYAYFAVVDQADTEYVLSQFATATVTVAGTKPAMVAVDRRSSDGSFGPKLTQEEHPPSVDPLTEFRGFRITLSDAAAQMIERGFSLHIHA